MSLHENERRRQQRQPRLLHKTYIYTHIKASHNQKQQPNTIIRIVYGIRCKTISFAAHNFQVLTLSHTHTLYSNKTNGSMEIGGG